MREARLKRKHGLPRRERCSLSPRTKSRRRPTPGRHRACAEAKTPSWREQLLLAFFLPAGGRGAPRRSTSPGRARRRRQITIIPRRRAAAPAPALDVVTRPSAAAREGGARRRRPREELSQPPAKASAKPAFAYCFLRSLLFHRSAPVGRHDRSAEPPRRSAVPAVVGIPRPGINLIPATTSPTSSPANGRFAAGLLCGRLTPRRVNNCAKKGKLRRPLNFRLRWRPRPAPSVRRIQVPGFAGPAGTPAPASEPRRTLQQPLRGFALRTPMPAAPRDGVTHLILLPRPGTRQSSLSFAV